MRQYRSNWLAAALLVSGCAFTDGDPWGRAEFRLAAAFDPPSSRLDGGALKTAQNYRLTVDELAVEIETVELEVVTSGEVSTFDPADPPEGYSLCHNGHCHSDAGELVDYEDIEVELGGGDYVATQLIESSVALGASVTSVTGDSCSNDCKLPRGALGNVRLTISEIRVASTVSRVGDDLEPYDIDLIVPVDTRLSAPLPEGAVGPGEPGIVELDIRFDPGAELFDNVDFAADAPSDASPNFTQLSDALRAALETNAVLDVDVERRAFPKE